MPTYISFWFMAVGCLTIRATFSFSSPLYFKGRKVYLKILDVSVTLLSVRDSQSLIINSSRLSPFKK